MKTYYLIYVYRGEIRIKKCERSTACKYSFKPIDPPENRKYYLYTNIPEEPMVLQHGKIYCETLGNVPECVRIMKNHYKDRVLQLERGVELGRMVTNFIYKEATTC